MSNVVSIGVSALKNYEVLDAEGNHLFTLSFNPADINMRKRYRESLEWFENAKKVANEEEIDELTEEFCGQIDYIVGNAISDEAFRVNPFTPMEDGRIWFEHVIEVIGKCIGETVEERRKKAQEYARSRYKK